MCIYAHGVRRVVHRGAPQVPPHCAVLHYNAAMKAHDSEDFKVAMTKEANDLTTRLYWALWEKHNVPAAHKILSATWATLRIEHFPYL